MVVRRKKFLRFGCLLHFSIVYEVINIKSVDKCCMCLKRRKNTNKCINYCPFYHIEYNVNIQTNEAKKQVFALMNQSFVVGGMVY